MACTLAGGIALVVLCVAVALNTTALVLPLWSTTSFTASDSQSSVQEADLTAGVWGFCTDASVKTGKSNSSASGTVSFDQCFYFHMPSSVDLPAFFSSTYGNTSVCSGYEAASSNATALQDYVSTFATIAAQNETAFAAFLDRSCGALGYSSLIFEFTAPIASTFGLLALCASVVCSHQGKRPLISTVGKALVFLAFMCAALALVLWIPQVHSLQDVHFGGGLVLGVISIALYLNSLALVARHEKGSARGPGQGAGSKTLA